MIIPKKLKIGGHVYKVILDGKIKAGTSMGQNCGQLNRFDGMISVNKNLIRTEQEETLFHEIFHAMNNEINEALVESLSQQWYQVLKDNNLLQNNASKNFKNKKRVQRKHARRG